MRYIESVNTLYLAKILNYIVYEEIAIYINYILHDVCFPKNMGVMPRATLLNFTLYYAQDLRGGASALHVYNKASVSASTMSHACCFLSLFLS